MARKALDRIVFYGNYDATIVPNLKKIASFIQELNLEVELEPNDILELYNVQQIIENGHRLKEWTDAEYSNIKKSIKNYNKRITEFIVSVDNENIYDVFEKVHYRYRDSFWQLFNKFNCQKSIEGARIEELLDKHKTVFQEICQFKKLVGKYSAQINEYIKSNPKTLQYILNQKESNTANRKVFFLPKSFSDDMMNNLVETYLAINENNLNYLDLILNSTQLNLKDETRFKVFKRREKVHQEFFEKYKGVPIGVEVEIDKNQIEPKVVEYDKSQSLTKYTYGGLYLKNTLDFKFVFYNFRFLFNYINFQGCIGLVYKESQGDLHKLFGLHSQNEYPKNPEFIQNKMLSDRQLWIYRSFLRYHKIEVEEVLKMVIEEFLPEHFGVNFRLNFPSKTGKPWEKFRSLAPELDSLMKQYNRFVKKGEIDMEFIQFQSKPISFSQVKSKNLKKYAYGKGNKYKNISELLCSSQSTLLYVRNKESNHRDLCEMLDKEDLRIEDFETNQKPAIQFLINNGILFLDKYEHLRIEVSVKIIFLCLYHQKMISSFYLTKIERSLLNKYEKEGLVEFKSTLFTENEVAYLNFYLNKKQFTNGYELRNKYLHGSNSESEERQEFDYNALLKIFILVLHKIVDDLGLFDNQN